MVPCVTRGERRVAHAPLGIWPCSRAHVLLLVSQGLGSDTDDDVARTNTFDQKNVQETGMTSRMCGC